MNIRERLKRWSKLRFAALYPIGAFAAVFSNSDDKSTLAAIGFIMAGLFIRAWANGYAIKMDKLTTCGPYAFIRHPLYFGSMFIAIGFIVMLKLYYVGILAAVIMIMVYQRTIKQEEAMLEAKFKDIYIKYKKKVPAMFPTIFPYRKGEKWPFSFRRLIQSQEYKLFIWVVIIAIGFHLKDELMVEREAIDAKMIGLFAIAFILSMVDLTGEIIKWKKRSLV